MKTFVRYCDGGILGTTHSPEWIAKVVEGECPYTKDHEQLNTPSLRNNRLEIHEADPRWAICSLGTMFQVVTE